MNELFRKIISWVRSGFTGQIILHCDAGRVRKVETRKFERVEDE